MPVSVGYDTEVAALNKSYREGKISLGVYNWQRGKLQEKYFPAKDEERWHPPHKERYPYLQRPLEGDHPLSRRTMVPSREMLQRGVFSPFADYFDPSAPQPAAPSAPQPAAPSAQTTQQYTNRRGLMPKSPAFGLDVGLPPSTVPVGDFSTGPRPAPVADADGTRRAPQETPRREWKSEYPQARLAMTKPDPSVSPFSAGADAASASMRALKSASRGPVAPSSTKTAHQMPGPSSGERSMYQSADIGDSYNRTLQRTFLAASGSAAKQVKAGIPLFFAPVMDYRKNHLYFVRADGTRHMVDLNTSEGMDKMDVALAKTGFVQHFVNKGLDEDSARQRARMMLFDWSKQNSSHLEQFLDPGMKEYESGMPGMQPTNSINEVLGVAANLQNPDDLEALINNLDIGGLGVPKLSDVPRLPDSPGGAK